MKIRGLIGVCGLMLMLVGCSAEADSGDASSVESIAERMTEDSNNEKISNELYNELESFIDTDVALSEKTDEYFTKMQSYEKNELAWEQELRNEFTAHLDQHTVHLFDINLETTTDEEYKLSSYLNNYANLAMTSSLEMTKYVDTLNESNLDEYEEYKEKANLAAEDLEELMEEYDLLQ